MPGISVIIPTYNEKDNIERIIGRCLKALSTYDVEIIVVDDDSPDRTWELAQKTYSGNSSVHVIRRIHDRGLATAITEGFQEASKEYCAVIDADLQHPPEKLPDLLDALEQGADIAIGSRHIAGGGIENWSRTRKLVSWGATKVAKACVPATRGISDPMSGFFAVRRRIVTGVELNPTGYKILLELLTKCDYHSVVEVPYVFTEREHGESKLTATQYQSFLEHIIMLAVLSYGLAEYMSPERAVRAVEFAAVGGFGVLVNMAVFTGIYGAGFHHMIAGFAAFLVAVNTNFFGNWAITFDRPNTAFVAKWGKFHAVSVVGFIVYTAALAVSIEMLLLPALLGNAVAIGSSSVFNFVGSERFAFDVMTDQGATSSSDQATSSD
jgi:dolichol-phosphate mannosyltransferase